MGFVHLHSHTEYSVLDANNRVKDYVNTVKGLGQTAAAITDHGVMYGTIAFDHACHKVGIKPIFGCEFYVAPESVAENDPRNRYDHLVCLAENDEGFKNLSTLCTYGFTAGGMYYGKPRVDDTLLRMCHKGIIALSACLAGRIPKLILKGDYEGAKKQALDYRELFGDGNFYLEIQNHNDPQEKQVAQALAMISKETGIPLVATNDCHYATKEDASVHETLLYMRDKKTVLDPSPEYGNGQLYVKSEEEMRNLYPSLQEAFDNTVAIADRCNVNIKYHERKMPKAPDVPEGSTSEKYFESLCWAGFAERYKNPATVDRDRKQLQYEIDTIEHMGFTDYFLIVREYVNWAKENGIPMGLGRGSAAGSMVTYCLTITDVDPTQYDLYFERFLNPERVTMPDIDTDMSDRGRARIIEHVKKLYGDDCVSQIVTFTTMAAKASVKAVGRVLKADVGYCNRLAKMIPDGPKVTLSSALEDSQDFKNAYDTDAQAKKIIDIAMKLEGLPSATSKHASGVIIASRPVSDYVPLAYTKDNDLVSQYNMIEIEELGLLKMDFLGLKTLSVIEDAVENIKLTTGKAINPDLIPLDDAETYEYIGRGKTSGVFQLESAGMMDFMKKLKPKKIEDIIAGIALYRPGPMDFIPKYLEGKNNPSNVTYATPLLKPILENTYGCIVYQEQVMQIFRSLAGYSLGGADLVRRAMSKKHYDEIMREKDAFINGDPKRNIKGCVANGIPAEVAEEIFSSMEAFASYAFNKSHATCYAIITYRTAWLKCHFEKEYMAAIITQFLGTPNKYEAYTGDVRQSGIKLMLPSINKATEKCIPEPDGIRLALTCCKGVGSDVAEKIVERRKLKGGFTSFGDYAKESDSFGANKTAVASLIKAGAFDGMGNSRKSLLGSYAEAVDGKGDLNFARFIKSFAKENKSLASGQMSFAEMFPDAKEALSVELPDCPEYSDRERLDLEKDALGIFVSGHPLDEYRELVAVKNTVNVTDLTADNRNQNICLFISKVKKIYTNKGDRMAFLTTEDFTGAIDVIVFPKLYEEAKDLLDEDSCIMVSGHAAADNKSDDEEEKINFIADKIYPLDKVGFRFCVRFDNEAAFAEHREKLFELAGGTGIGNMVVFLSDIHRPAAIPRSHATFEGYKKIKDMFGADNVKMY